jgi:cytochrome P450
MTEVTMNNLSSQETKRNPHAFFAPLRSAEAIYYVEGLNSWILTTHEDAMMLFKDPRFTKDNRKITPPEDERNARLEEMTSVLRFMLMTDPPDHTRLRSLVSKAFTPRMIELLRPRIQQIADDLLDVVQDRGTMDIITEFAYPLPITVILEMLGIPTEDRQKFRDWTQMIISGQAGNHTGALQEFLQYIRTLLDEKRAHPDDRLVSKLVQAEEQGDQLSEQEMVSMIFLLIVAGHETTVNLLGNGTLALLQHPEQFQMLRRDPSLVPMAVEEFLRYTAPVSLSDERWATEDITLHGKVIRKGQMVVASLLSANADPQHCPDGDTLDVMRQENQHLAFGKGIHFCLGAPLARMEGQIAFSTLLRRLPNLRLSGDPDQLVWNANPMLRGLTKLPVTF